MQLRPRGVPLSSAGAVRQVDANLLVVVVLVVLLVALTDSVVLAVFNVAMARGALTVFMTVVACSAAAAATHGEDREEETDHQQSKVRHLKLLFGVAVAMSQSDATAT